MPIDGAYDKIPMYITTEKRSNRVSSSWCIKVGMASLLIAISILSLVFKTSILFGKQIVQPTKMSGGGRDFDVNDDGTISVKHASNLVLGLGMEPMVLVEKGSDQQLVFEDDVVARLKNGTSYVVLKLKSHPGKGIGKATEVEQISGVWRYEPSAVVSENEAIRVRYEDSNFIKLANEDLVFDVSFWKMASGNAVNYVGGTSKTSPTKMGGGGRDWTINDDGTISPKNHPVLVLGSASPPVVLVQRGSPEQFVLNNVSSLKAGNIVNATLASHPGSAIGKKYDKERITGDHAWRYIESAFLPESKALQIRYEENNFITLPEEDLVFDVSYWKLVEGNTVNFIGSTTHVETNFRKKFNHIKS